VGGYYGSGYGVNSYNANIWSSTEYSNSNAYYRGLCFNDVGVDSDNYGKNYGYSVRRLRD
jgi:hypothetical protein